tara:strand:+ start:1992 stop:2345 length:354 start_codon:yes stop_codon:yes gene_type:complete
MIKISKKNVIGPWAFLIGIVAAVTIGAFNAQVSGISQQATLWSLVILGIIIGLLNISNKESTPFLLASVSLVIVSHFGSIILGIIPILGNILVSLLILFIPTTIIVALKLVFEMSKD